MILADVHAVAYHNIDTYLVPSSHTLQVENLLLTSDGGIKLCDFGSATINQLNPDSSWTSVQRGLAEDEVCTVLYDRTHVD